MLGNIVTPIPVTLDGQAHTVTVPLEQVAHTLRPGETVTLQLVASAGIYATIIPSLGALNVSSMQLALPTTQAAPMPSAFGAAGECGVGRFRCRGGFVMGHHQPHRTARVNGSLAFSSAQQGFACKT